MLGKIKLKILFGKGFNSEWQDKTFKDESSAIEWCRKNYSNIVIINEYRTLNNPISHFELMDAIRGKTN